MFSRFAAVVGVVLVSSAPAFALSPATPTLEWNGEINRSCSITADRTGTVTLRPGKGKKSLLDSTYQGGRPAILGYEAIGGKAEVKFVSGSVLRNGTEERLVNGATRSLEISYNDGKDWDIVFQNNHANWVGNQDGKEVEGSGTLEVEARTNAHTNQKGDVESGNYIVKTVMACNI